MSEEKLSALLRLKRYEQPPAGYFDRLLQDVHRRQRSELLQLPLWQIALDRLRVFFSEHSMGNLTYAGSMAAVLIVGVAAIGLMTDGRGQVGKQVSVAASQSALPPERSITLEVPAPAIAARTFPAAHAEPAVAVSKPRYVMDARPVSYEPSRNIAF